MIATAVAAPFWPTRARDAPTPAGDALSQVLRACVCRVSVAHSSRRCDARRLLGARGAQRHRSAPRQTRGTRDVQSVIASRSEHGRCVTLPLPAGDARTGPSQRAAVTVQRHKAEARAAKLTDIRAQIADGTLVVRQMTVTEHRAASQAASRSRSQHQARRRLYKPRHDQEPPG